MPRLKKKHWIPGLIVLLTTLGFLMDGGVARVRGQHYEQFITRTPLPEGNTLVIGFLGGREHWNNERLNGRRLALKLRALNLPGVHVETAENMRRDVVLELVRNAFDRNRDGMLDAQERSHVRLIIYGQSFGGAAVVKLANQLHEMEVPVLLTVQVDSVGLNDGTIPSNVARAANLYQANGLVIRGQPEIHAADAMKTIILGNWRYDYSHKEIDLSLVPWYRKAFRTAHIKMDNDPEVWARVESLILQELR